MRSILALQPRTKEDEMKLRNAFIWGSLAATLATGACDASKPELDKAKAELAAITAERDALRSQLDTAKKEETGLTAQIADLNTKLNAVRPSTSKAGEHAQATEEKGSKKAAHASSRKSKA
jgi:chromosome segregation ATPase